MRTKGGLRPWLILPPPVWREQIPRLVRAGSLGVARLARNFHDEASELVAGDLTPAASTIRGIYFGPLDDLLLIQPRTDVSDSDAERLIAQFSPLTSQLVAVLVLGFGPSAGRWVGVVNHAGEQHELTGITLVGSGMRRIVSDERWTVQPTAELNGEQWSRTRGALGETVFGQVRSAQVAVIGASRNGSVAATTLAMLGVSRIVLVDNDRDEWHNLSATIGATSRGIGRPKVSNRAEFLHDIRGPQLQVVPLATSVLDASVLDHLRSVDLVVTCVDRDAPRLAAALVANRLGKLHLDIGTGVFRGEPADAAPSVARLGGDIRLCLPREACVACLGGLRRFDEAWYELSSPPGILRRGPRRRWNDERAGSLVTVNQIAVNLGIQMWLDLLAGRIAESRWCQLEWTQQTAVPQITTETESSPTCTICRGLSGELTRAA